MLRADATLLFDLLIILCLLVTISICTGPASPGEAQAGPTKDEQRQQTPLKEPPKSEPSCATSPPKKKDRARGTNALPQPQAPKTRSISPAPQRPKSNTKRPAPGTQPSAPITKPTAPSTQHPAPSPQHSAPSTQHSPPSTQHRAPPAPFSTYHGTFLDALSNAPFPYSGKDDDPHFFDFTDPRTGERFRTTRSWERLSEKEHYRDSSVLFYVPSQFNPNKPFSYVVFFHGNWSDVRQSLKDYRLDGQIENSGKNVILVLPQLAKKAADSNPGKFSRKNVFKAFMQEAAQVLAQKLGKKYRRPLAQAPIILVAFSGGYKPLACVLDRGGTGPRIRGVLLLDALYEDLYIFGKWLLDRSGGSFFVNIFTEGSACEEKTGILARFLREHRVPFKEEWPKASAKQRIYLVRSSSEHLQVPLEGPPRDPLTAVLRRLRM